MTAQPMCAWLGDGLLLVAGGAGTPDPVVRVEPGEVAVVRRAAGDDPDELVDLRTLLRARMLSWTAGSRERLVTALAGLLREAGGAQGLAPGLHLVREALRERLPLATAEACRIDRLHRIGDRQLFVVGRAAAAPASLVAVAPEGARCELAGRLARLDAPEGFAFAAFFELDAPSVLDDGWVFELRDAAGGGAEVHASLSATPDELLAETLLADARVETCRDDDLLAVHVRPAVRELQRRCAARPPAVDVVDVGHVPVAPELSVVVALRGAADLLEHQILQFCDDPDLRAAQLVYVADAAAPGDEPLELARQLFALYGLPLRLVALRGHEDPATARDAGAAAADGRRVLFLDPDVLPTARGWASALLDIFEATENAGALAPKLLHEDDAIRHAGLGVRRSAVDGAWDLEHPFQGMHRDLPAADVPRRVPAVTGACMMIDRVVLERVGGLGRGYLGDGYAAADLCLRVREAGLVCWYVPAVELYHLELTGPVGPARERATAYDRGLYAQRWGRATEAAAVPSPR